MTYVFGHVFATEHICVCSSYKENTPKHTEQMP
jgi:hypothetical protein